MCVWRSSVCCCQQVGTTTDHYRSVGFTVYLLACVSVPCSSLFCSLGAEVFHLLGYKSWHLHSGVGLPVPARPLLHDHRWIDHKFFPFKWTYRWLLLRGDRGGVAVVKRKAKEEHDRTFNTNVFCCTLSYFFLMSFQWLKAWSPKNAWGATCATEFTPMGSGAALRTCVTEQHTLEYLPLCFWHLLPSLHSWSNLQLHPCSCFCVGFKCIIDVWYTS